MKIRHCILQKPIANTAKQLKKHKSRGLTSKSHTYNVSAKQTTASAKRHPETQQQQKTKHKNKTTTTQIRAAHKYCLWNNCQRCARVIVQNYAVNYQKLLEMGFPRGVGCQSLRFRSFQRRDWRHQDLCRL